MMRKFGISVSAAVFAIGLLLPGCATPSKPEPPVTVPLERMTVSERDSQARKVAVAYMENFTTAFRERDIEKFKLAISEERRQKLTPEVFAQILDVSQRQQGTLLEAEALTVLDQDVYQTFLWKMTYEKADANGSPGRRDYLYFVSIGKTGEDKYEVAAAGFRL